MPKIEAETLGTLYLGKSQYIIPPYQRTITWPEQQWDALFEDVVFLINNPDDQHLFQIFQLGRRKRNTNEYEVGDGQQRLIQTSLLLAALAYKAEEITRDKSLPEKSLKDLSKIQNSILPYCSDNSTDGVLSFTTKKGREPRIVVAPSNAKIYATIILWDMDTKNDYKNYNEKVIVSEAFKFYLNRLTNFLAEKSIIQKVKDIQELRLAIEDRLVFAVAYFGENESMQTSYEATNSRGVSLTDSELIKNHIFQEFDLDDQKELVKDYWNKFDETDNYWINKPVYRLSDNKTSTKIETGHLDKYLKYDILSRMSNPETFTGYSLFENFKRYHAVYFKNSKMDKKSYYRDYLKDLKIYTSIYKKFVLRSEQTNPSYKEPAIQLNDITFSKQESLWWEFYHRLSVGCKRQDDAMILLLAILRCYKNNEEIIKIMAIIESYAIRKVIVKDSCKNSIELFLPLIHQKFSAKQISERISLKADAHDRWESDELIIEVLKTKQFKNSNRLFTILNIDYENGQKNIIRDYAQKIEYKNQSLEHFMPQNPKNPDVDWPLDLPEGVTREDTTYNFGNFILLPPGVNTEVGNWSRDKKISHFLKDANEHGATGSLSVDNVGSLNTWGYNEIISEGKKKAIVILDKYKGPKATIIPNQVKTQMDKGHIHANQKVYVDLINGESKKVGIVTFDGFIRLEDGTTTGSLSEIKKNTYRQVNEKQKSLRYED